MEEVSKLDRRSGASHWTPDWTPFLDKFAEDQLFKGPNLVILTTGHRTHAKIGLKGMRI